MRSGWVSRDVRGVSNAAPMSTRKSLRFVNCHLYWRAISGPSFDRARQRVAKGSARKEGARIADAVPLTNPGIHTHTTK